MIENAAVFYGGQRKYKSVNVDVEPEWVIVRNRVNGDEIVRYSVVEVAKSGMAWDVPGLTDGSFTRLVVQQGCGCSGMHPYDLDTEYSGRLTEPRR